MRRSRSSGARETRMCGVAWPGMTVPEKCEEGSTWRSCVAAGEPSMGRQSLTRGRGHPRWKR